MNKKQVEANHSSKKDKSKNKGKTPYQMIREGLSKADAERMAKHKIAKQSK
ncbi:hypothetical protein SRABI96_02453 [Peribacillus sp. Bi96]|uniref:hypothetical protein n=1 Tax=Peribacillus sp. Bi96 TaxID=2884273 RepID=UPI001DDA1A6E|nr:hypothetical protein [Peribacillus sp. Bi96]CAH0222767.1 hypothetical protein SRABI96_02453 [Peribacillus sp. Bi96]